MNIKEYLHNTKIATSVNENLITQELEEIHISQLEHPILLRKSTSDRAMFDQVIANNDYKHLHFTEKPQIIIDGGCNIGLFSILMKHNFPESKIIAIEPDPSNFQMCQKNLQYYDNIELLNMGIWWRSARLSIVTSDNTVGNFAHCGFRVQEDMNGAIDAISISDILQRYDLNYIDVLKLDIETSEKYIFENDYEEWLPKVKMLVIEFHDNYLPGCAKAFFTALNKVVKNYSYSITGENTVIVNIDAVKASKNVKSKPLLIQSSTTSSEKGEMSKKPLVSFIMPVYNAEMFVVETINSILQQTYTNWECVIVDDCSTDDSYNVIHDYLLHLPAEMKSKFKILQNKENLRKPRTVNYGVSQSNGELIFVMDNDDLLMPMMLQKFVDKFLETGADVGSCYQHSFEATSYLIRCGEGGVFSYSPWTPVIWRLMLTRRAFDAVGGYAANVDAMDDYEITIRLRTHKYDKAFTIPEVLYLWREQQKVEDMVGSTQLSSYSQKNKYQQNAQAILNSREFYHPLYIRWAEEILAGSEEARKVFPIYNDAGVIIEFNRIVPQFTDLLAYYYKNAPDALELMERQLNEKIVPAIKRQEYRKLIPFTMPDGNMIDLELLLVNGNASYVLVIGHKESVMKEDLSQVYRGGHLHNHLVSVIIPMYNTEKYIVECVESVINQTYTNWECVIVDDCSTDGSLYVLKDYVSHLPTELRNKFKILQNERNSKISATRNYAIQESSGYYVFPVDSDDYIEKNCLEEFIIAFSEKDVDVVSCYQRRFGAVNSVHSPITLVDYTPWITTLWRICFRKDMYEKVGGYSKEQQVLEDAELPVRFYRYGYTKGYCVPKILYNWRFHATNNAVHASDMKYFINYARMVLHNNELYNKYYLVWAEEVLKGNKAAMTLQKESWIIPDFIDLLHFFEVGNWDTIRKELENKYIPRLHKQEFFKRIPVTMPNGSAIDLEYFCINDGVDGMPIGFTIGHK